MSFPFSRRPPGALVGRAGPAWDRAGHTCHVFPRDRAIGDLVPHLVETPRVRDAAAIEQWFDGPQCNGAERVWESDRASGTALQTSCGDQVRE